MTAPIDTTVDAYRLWLAHWIATGNLRALRTADICQQIVLEQLATARAEAEWRRFEGQRGSEHGEQEGGSSKLP
jgi:hypothetical protein